MVRREKGSETTRTLEASTMLTTSRWPMVQLAIGSVPPAVNWSFGSSSVACAMKSSHVAARDAARTLSRLTV